MDFIWARHPLEQIYIRHDNYIVIRYQLNSGVTAFVSAKKPTKNG